MEDWTVGKVEKELAGLIDRRIKRALKEALGDMPQQIQQIQKDLAALSAAPADEAAPAPEPAPKVRFTKRTISTLRKKLKLSRKDLAAQLGVSVHTVASWAGGRTKPRAAALVKIAGLRKAAPADAKKATKPVPKAAKKSKPVKKAEKATAPTAKPVKEAAAKKAPKQMAAQTIKKIRKGLGLSQAAFAKKLGVSANSIGNWETGHAAPRGANLAKLNELK
jgi:putative transcriptional regulator